MVLNINNNLVNYKKGQDHYITNFLKEQVYQIIRFGYKKPLVN